MPTDSPQKFANRTYTTIGPTGHTETIAKDIGFYVPETETVPETEIAITNKIGLGHGHGLGHGR